MVVTISSFSCVCVSVNRLFYRFAFYALIMGIAFVVGLPVVVFVLLFRRRHKLFGDPQDPFVSTTAVTFGFLYEVG